VKLLPSKVAGKAVHAARERRFGTAKPAATYGLLAAAFLWAAPAPAAAQVAVLHIQVVEGQDVAHLPGSRSTRPLTVQVTGETGQPVEGAAVTFHLPDEGPGGTFSNGLRTDVATTDARGRASSRSLQANGAAGRFQVRIVASKEQARAGTVCWQSVDDAGAAPSPTLATPARASASAAKVSRGRIKWIALAAVAAGGAAAGVLAAGRSGGATRSSGAAAPVTVGTPIIAVGKP